jgi:endonuclease/exonuclease/phosphatase family metal-dependent hydrolase
MQPFTPHSPLARLTKYGSIALILLVGACNSDRALTAIDAPASARSTANNERDRELTVMTQNIYQGTELENSIAAKTPQEFVAGATQDFLMMRQTDFSARAGAMVKGIAASEPDLIGLQEVALWRSGPHTAPATPAARVEQDFLQILLDTLAAHGLHYSTVSTVNNFDVQGPALLSAAGLTDVRLTDRDVILARTDGSGAELKPSNSQAANYATNLVLPTVAGPITVLEGWASIDVKYRGQTIRFITTHLDANVPQIRLAQANELLSGPANTDLPVIVAGDMNTTSSTDTYAAITGAGFSDVWAQLHPGDDGFTCCQTLPAITNSISTLFQRVDLFLVRGDLEAGGISRVGADPSDRTVSGLWPSDHAGLAATVLLKTKL